jgi:uncharacterized protein (TIGR03435 family)
MNLTRFGIAAAVTATLAFGQTAFDVASIKPSGPKSVRGSDGGPGSKDPTRYTFGRADLRILAMIAYDVDSFQLSSPIPLDLDEFDLAARIPAGTTKQQFRIMLRNLLAERFHFKLHLISKEFAGYELVVAKTGPKLNQYGQLD